MLPTRQADREQLLNIALDVINKTKVDVVKALETKE
jgi:hypothetical protein